jgi:hypothetical protein
LLDSNLAKHLVNERAWGHISAAEVQRISALAFEDESELLRKLGQPPGSGSSSIRALATLGSFGKHSQNIHRDLVAFLGEPDSPQPLQVPISIKSLKPLPNEDAVRQEKMPFFLPHAEFAHFYNNRKHFFDEFVLGGSGFDYRIAKFWETVKQNKDPKLIDHPLLDRPMHTKFCIPISVHGDAVPCIGVGKAGFVCLKILNATSSMLRRPKYTTICNI